MKKSILYLSFLTVVLFSACSDEVDSGTNFIDNSNSDKIVLTHNELMSISFDKVVEASEENVYSMIADFLTLKSGDTQTRSTSNMKFVVKEKSYLANGNVSAITRSSDLALAEESIPVYKVMVEENGKSTLAYVSADMRAPGVLAIFDNFPSDETAFEIGMNEPNTKAIFALTEIDLVKDISDVEELRSELREKTIEKICNELDIPVSEYTFENVINNIQAESSDITITRGYPVFSPPTQLVTRKLPLTNIAWHQKEPYNENCLPGKILISVPGLSPWIEDGHVPAGCITMAVAMIDACTKRTPVGGQTLDWGYYNANPKLFSSGNIVTPSNKLTPATKMISYIYTYLGSFSIRKSLNGESYVSATGAYMSDAYKYINEFYNYDGRRSFDPDLALNSLNQGRPVLVDGDVYGSTHENPNANVRDGHAFVLDGYMICQKSSSLSMTETRADIVKMYDMYWHLNLVWGSECSAYFKLNSNADCFVEVDDQWGRYSYLTMSAQTMTYGIRKK